MSHLPTSPGGRSLELLKVAELRDELRKKGLSLKGVKKELFERLEDAIKEEQEGIVHGEQGTQEGGAHKTNTSDGTEDFEEEDEALDETKDKASTCPSDALPKTDEPTSISDTHASSGVSAPAGVPEDKEQHILLSMTGEATPISETHALSGVSAPAGVPGFNEDREQHNATPSVGTNNDVLFVDNAVCENGDAMVLPEKVPSVTDALEEASDNHETRPEIATSDLKAHENVDGAPESGFALSVNETIVSDVVNVSIENGNTRVDVENALSSSDASGADCAMQGDEKAAGPEVVAEQLSKPETLIEVSPSEAVCKTLMQPTLDSGLPADKPHEEKEVGDLKTESLSVASQNAFEPLADSKSDELEKPIGDERDMIVNDEKPDAKMEPMETDVRLEEKGEVEKSDVKMVPMEVDAGLVDKHILISEGNKEMHIDMEDPSQLKSPSKESQFKEVKLEKSSRDYAGESRVPDGGKSNMSDIADLKRVEDDSRAFINSKRKDTDLKQQEPAKRVRRWNSGKEVAVDALKPLTTDTVNEIILPESTEGSDVAAQRLTPKAVATSREVPLKPDSGNTQTVPPSTRAPSNSLKIERFVRPFTLKAVKDLLGEFGQCVDFWMDQIKTHCFVTYSSVNEAVAARNGLYGRKWPLSVGNFLVAEFVDSNEVKIRSEGLAGKAQAAPPTAQLRHANAPPTPPTRVAQAAPSFRSYSNTLPPSRFSRETQLPPVPKRDPEPAGLTLEDLFFKTKAKPSIYYLPLTDEQVAEKLAAAKNKQATWR